MQTKQVIIFRKDLLKGENGIRKGKFGACLGVGPYLSEELDKVTKEIFCLKPL